MTDIITNAAKLACVQRELKMRERVYPRWHQEGKMSAGKMEHELECMRAIIADYEELAKKERLV